MVTHRESNTSLYHRWMTMRQRCNNPNASRYNLYGKRGIKVCDSWNADFIVFRDWSLENGYKEELSLDRIDVNGNYEPSNCRWATQKQQINNTRRSSNLTYKGKTQTMKEWSEELGLNYYTIRSRLRIGWTVEDTFEIPMKGKGKNGTKNNNEFKQRKLLCDNG